VTEPEPPVRVEIWQRQDCIALTVLLGLWGLLLGLLAGGTTPLGEPPGVNLARVGLVSETINPNTATAASLRRLPLIGPVRAQAIVHYRRQAQAAGLEPAFRYREDLTNVPGVGPATIERAGTWLGLPSRAAAASRP